MTFYSGKDPRHVPLYSYAEASRYLRVPASTLRRWARRLGIGPTGRGEPSLSLANLVSLVCHMENSGYDHSDELICEFTSATGPDGLPSTVDIWLYGYDERYISLNPRVAFGQPTVGSTGIKTAVIAQRYQAGEPVELLSVDYEILLDEVWAALVFEGVKQA